PPGANGVPLTCDNHFSPKPSRNPPSKSRLFRNLQPTPPPQLPERGERRHQPVDGAAEKVMLPVDGSDELPAAHAHQRPRVQPLHDGRDIERVMRAEVPAEPVIAVVAGPVMAPAERDARQIRRALAETVRPRVRGFDAIGD